MDRLLPALVLLIVAVVLIGGLTPYGSATTPDSIRYLDVAHSIRAGDGIVYHNPGTGAEFVPFTTYPPLYPLALSVFVTPHTRGERSAARLAVVTLFLAGFLFHELIRPVGGRLALLAAIAFMACRPILAVYTYAWSESLAVPLLLIGCLAGVGLIDAANRERTRAAAIYLVVLALALGLQVWCRYIGVLFVVLLPASWILIVRRMRWAPDLFAAGLGLAGMIGALAWRNVRLTGFTSGAPRELGTKTLSDNLSDLAVALGLQVSSRPSVWIAAAVLGLALFAWKRWGRAGVVPELGQSTASHARRLAILATVGPLAYLVGLVVLRSARHFDDIDTRFVSMAFPSLMLLFALGLFCGIRSPTGSWPGAVLLGLSVTLATPVVAEGVAGFHETVANWGLRGSPGVPLGRGMEYVNLNTPGWALQKEAQLAMDRGRYAEALVVLYRALAMCDQQYPVLLETARAHAGVGDVARSLASTRDMLKLDSQQAVGHIPYVSAPFWEDATRYRAGIDYYRQLAQDLPEAAWLHQNVATLAMRLGDRDLVESAMERVEELKSTSP